MHFLSSPLCSLPSPLLFFLGSLLSSQATHPGDSEHLSLFLEGMSTPSLTCPLCSGPFTPKDSQVFPQTAISCELRMESSPEWRCSHSLFHARCNLPTLSNLKLTGTYEAVSAADTWPVCGVVFLHPRWSSISCCFWNSMNWFQISKLPLFSKKDGENIAFPFLLQHDV